jgi:hypothetical protein
MSEIAREDPGSLFSSYIIHCAYHSIFFQTNCVWVRIEIDSHYPSSLGQLHQGGYRAHGGT